MKKIITPYLILLLFIFVTGVFKTLAQSKYENPLIEHLNITYQFQKSLEVARFKFKKANSIEKKLFYNNCILRAYTNMDNKDSTLIYIKNSLELLPSVQDSELICFTYFRIGKAYMINNDINNCTKYWLKSINLAKKINLSYVLVYAYNELGNLIENDNIKMSLFYSDLAIKYSNDKNFDVKNLANLQIKIAILLNRSVRLISLGKINESLNDLLLVKTFINILPNNKITLIQLNTRFSLVYAKKNDKINSELYINEALKIALSLNDKLNIKECYRNMANNYFIFKEYHKAIFYSLKAVNYKLNKEHYLVGQIGMDSILYSSYQYVGDNENALKYYKNYIFLLNKYNEKIKINELNKISLKLMFEENEKKLALKELEKSKDETTIQFLVLFIFITVILIIVVLGYKHLENNRKKIIFKTIENSDKEINSIKSLLEWRNNKKTITQTAIIENDLNSATPELVNEYATNEPEIIAESNDKINFNIETSNVNYKNLYFELREVLETKQLYLNPELSLDDLIKVLGTNKKYLYYAIKSNYEDNFRSLLNDYRINHVKSLIVESINTHKKIHMEGIQESSGFQSTASFFRVFKSKTGLTPFEYTEQVKRKQKSVA